MFQLTGFSGGFFTPVFEFTQNAFNKNREPLFFLGALGSFSATFMHCTLS